MYHLRKARQDVHIYTDTYEREVKQMRATTHNGRASRKGAYLANKQHGNDKNIQTIEEYRRNPRSCPEEQIFMLGNKDFYIPVKTLEQICKEQLAWEEKEFPQVKVLDYAAHADEQGAPHIHIRRAWIGHEIVR